MMRIFKDQERIDWLRLIRTEHVGPVTFYQLLRRYGTAADALKALPELAKRGGRKKPLVAADAGVAEQELASAAASGQRTLFWPEPDYPPLLRQVEDAPPVLYALGDTALAARPGVALVGSRNASLNGRGLARSLAESLGQAGRVVVSGLARGIDAAAHEGSLATGTVAVLAGGADVVYPPENQKLYETLTAQGLVLAEMPPGTQPQARHFPRRNRIISGICPGVVVVEATRGSGSLITARLALEQGREVFAVPGSPLDPRSAGANGLIREGAHLVESARDILDVLAETPVLREKPRDLPPPPVDDRELEPWRKMIVELLSTTPADVDDLIRASGAQPAIVQMVLLELQLAGRLERHRGGRVSLVY